jgi:hypothetical protein
MEQELNVHQLVKMLDKWQHSDLFKKPAVAKTYIVQQFIVGNINAVKVVQNLRRLGYTLDEIYHWAENLVLPKEDMTSDGN